MDQRIVALCLAEQRIATWIGAQRHKNNRSANVADGQKGAQDALDIDRIGFGAELAFCKLFNCYPDFSIEPRQGTSDCEIGGTTIDVKTTSYPNGKLIAVLKKKELGSDFYALMLCMWPRYRFAGFAAAEDLLSETRLSDLGHGPTYAMDQRELKESFFDVLFE